VCCALPLDIDSSACLPALDVSREPGLAGYSASLGTAIGRPQACGERCLFSVHRRWNWKMKLPAKFLWVFNCSSCKICANKKNSYQYLFVAT
jgi:hypothetical protein